MLTLSILSTLIASAAALATLISSTSDTARLVPVRLPRSAARGAGRRR